MSGSFYLFTTRTAEATNELVRQLTFIAVMLGFVGAIASIFGMNFEIPYTQTGVPRFCAMVGGLALFIVSALIVARRKAWI